MITWEKDLHQQIEDLKEYIEDNNLRGDQFAERELAQLKEQLERCESIPRRFIVTLGKTEKEIENYLGFGATIIDRQDRTRRTSPGGMLAITGIVAIIEIPEEHVRWQSDRLSSGLHGNRVFETESDARVNFEEAKSF